ncbi:MAG: calcium-binding protein, partial [Planctomycetales bacterium]|nr:calcium-binding protein [Planctomycetales bacterium]
MKVPISKQTKLETGAGADQVRVKSTSGTTLVDTQGDSDNIVVANDAQTLVGIVGSLSVVGGSGTADALLVNNQGDLTGAAGSLSGVDVVGLGMSSRITYSVENLTIDLGNAADDFTVTGTHRGTTLINSFGGADQVTLDRVSGVTTVNLGSEDDTVTAVGLEDFETNVFLHGQGGTDQVIWDDTLSTAGRTGILAPSVLSGFAMGGTQSYDGFEDVLLRMSSFNDSVQVTPISFGQVRIDGGSGNDQITAFASHSGNLGDVTLELDGGLSDDRITTNLFGLNHVIINVTNSGGLLAGADTLVVNGSSNGDYFYLDGRGADADITKGLVAMGANSYTEPQRDEVHYRQMDLLIVRSHSGNDNFQVDDNSVETLINLGQGADQVFVANVVTRIDDGVEVVDLDQTSHGVSAKTTIVGGDDNDYFEINHNVAELFLYGDDGDDTFVINTFLVIRDETTNEVKNLTSITGGDGADRYEYLQNALVNIDGGAGNDTVVINGTPIGDVMVVTESLAIAGGRLVYFDNIERLEINASGGDDEIYVLGTKEGVETVVRGGSGEDNIHLGGDHPAFLFDPPQQLISQPVVETTYTETTTVTTVTPSPVLTTVQTFGFASVADGTWINSISLPPTAIFLTAQIVNVHSSFVNFQLIITYDIAIFYKFPDLVTTEDVTHTYTETIAPQAQLFDANPYFFKEDAVHDLRAIQGKLTIDAGTTLGDNDRIFVHNTNGTDSDGALVTTTVPDREATLVQKKYENGDPLFEIVQSTDAFGNPLFDANGKPITEQIPVYEQVQFPVLDENGDPVTTLVQVFEEDHVTPVLDAAGNFVYEEVQVYTSGFQNVLDESGNVVTREYLNLQGFGLGSGEQIDQSPYSGVELVGLEEVVLYLSDQAEHLTLENTFDGQTTVVLGDGDDTVDVQQIDGPTRILGGAGSDTVNVANDQQTVDQIAANLTFEGDKHLAEVLVPIPPTDPILNESDALFVDNGVAMIEVADIDQDGRIKTIQVQATDTDDLDSDGNTSEFLYITASGELVTTDTGIPFIVPEVVMRSVPLNYANGTVSLTTLTPGDDVTNEAQSLVRFGVPAGTFQLERLGNRTSSLAYNATAQQLQDALNQLPDMPVVAVTGSGVSGDPWVITYSVPGDQPPLIARDGELRKVVESDHPTDGNGTAYADHLFLDSSGSTTDLTGTLTNTQLFGLQSNGTITYSQLETMTVSLGSGHDTFNVQGTKASTQLNTGAGDDRILVASDANADLTDGVTSHGHVDHITSPLSIDAQSGDNQLMISDFDSNSPDLNVGITDHSVTGLAPADISYQATAAGTFSDGMVVWTGSNNDTVRISSLELSGETITSVYAGEGDDTIQSTVADNLVSPAHANLPLNTDRRLRIITAQGADVVDLGSAQLATHVETGTGRDVIKGGSGDDLLWAGLGSDVVFGGPGHDIIRPDDAQADAAGSGNDIVFGDNGSVTYVANGNDVTLASYDPNGSLDPYRPATDHVLKTAAATTGPAVGGNDDILSLWGEDIIVAGAGQDTIDARSNADRNIIFGDHGQVNFDTNGNLISAASTDVTIGDSDTILAGEGDDVLFGGSQADRIKVHAVASRTVAFGDHGQATFDAQGNWLQVQSLFETTGGNDLLVAVDGHDVLLGGFGSDTITGGAGDNLIIGDDGQIDYLDNRPQY